MSTPLRERPDAPLGTLIFRAGLLPAETIENALEEGVKTGRRLGEILIERGLIKEEDLTRLLAGQKGLPYVSVRERGVDQAAARLLAEDQARLFTALPVGFEDGVPLVAVADPTNDVLNRNIREALGQEARFVVAARSELNEMISEVFSGSVVEAPAEQAPDLSVPVPEPEPEPQHEAEAEAEPEPSVDAAPEAPPRFAVADYAPEPTPEPAYASTPEPAYESTPEPEPLREETEPEPLAPAAFEAPSPEAQPQPAPAPAVHEAPAEPEPLVAPLAAEPVAAQSVPASNGDGPHDFEDDPPPPAAAAAAGPGFRVSIRLTSGERMTVAECADLGEAKGYAKALTKQLGTTDSDDWPFVNGRFLKPDTIVSVDVETP
jgi:Type II secretion system (T2SS), protein E, N-terminal domain